MLRLSPFRLAVRPVVPSPRLAAAYEWALFACCLAMLAGTIWGRTRTTGPGVLMAAVVVGWACGLADRRWVVRRLVVLAVAFAAAYVLRNYAFNLLAHRGGRFVLVSGVGLAAILCLPAAVRAWVVRLADRIDAAPTGWRAAVVAAAGVVLPVFLIQANTTEHVWTGDTMPVLPTVVQQYRHGDRDLTGYLPGNGYTRWDNCGPGRPYFVRESPTRPGVYANYPAGMELFAWPAVLFADALGRDLTDDKQLLWLEKLTAAGVAAGALGLFFLAAVRVGGTAAGFATTWLLATGSVFTSTVGMLLWQQGGVVFWMMLALCVEIRGGGRPRQTGTILQGIACGCMVACRPSAVTFLVPFGLWVLSRSWKRGLAVPAIAGLAFLPWALVYWSIYRQPFGPAMMFLSEQWFPGDNVSAVLFSPGRGLVVYQPWMLFLPVGLIPAARAFAAGREYPPGFVPFAVVMIALHVFLVASWPMWWGGFCYGSRLAAEVIPVAGLLAVRPIGYVLRTPGGWAVAAAVGLLGFAVHAGCVYHDAWLWNALPVSADAHPERLWDWGRPPFLYNLLPPRP